MQEHISEQYHLELANLRARLMSMGGLVEKQVNNACAALVTHDIQLAQEVRTTEARLNQMEVELDDECVSVSVIVIAKRQRLTRSSECHEADHRSGTDW